MFYSAELLSLRRNAKFAKCWLAANLSAKVFWNKFRRQTIADINIDQTCTELVTYVNTRSSQLRLSLYLSSQLMFGVTRILFYQTDLYLKLQWELWIHANAGDRPANAEDRTGKKRGKKLPLPAVDQTLLPPEEPPADVHTLRHIVDESEITMPEVGEKFVGENHVMMRDPDWLNFGAITAEEMDEILEPDGLRSAFMKLGQTRIVPGLSSPSIFRSPSRRSHSVTFRNGIIDASRLPDADGTLAEIPLMELPEEQSDVPLPLREELPRTPVKRKSSPPPEHETPTRKKQGLDGQLVPDLVPEMVPEPIDQPPLPILVQVSSNDLLLEPLDTSTYMLPSRKKKDRKLKVDINTRLLSIDSHHQHSKTSEPVILLPTRTSANELLTVPSTYLAWGKVILAIYESSIRKLQCVPQPRGRTHSPEFVRPYEPVRFLEQPVDEPPIDISEIKKDTTTSVEVSGLDQHKTIEAVSMDEVQQVHQLPLVDRSHDVPPPSDYLARTLELPVVDEPSSDISNLPGIIGTLIGEWEDERRPSAQARLPRERIDKSVTKIAPTAKDSEETSTSRSSTAWVKADICGILETFWPQKKIVYFRHICPPYSCTRREASQVFVLLLELQKSKTVKLTQSAPYCEICIQKYSTFF